MAASRLNSPRFSSLLIRRGGWGCQARGVSRLAPMETSTRAILKRAEPKLLEYDSFNQQNLLSFFATRQLRITVTVCPVFAIYIRFDDIPDAVQRTRATIGADPSGSVRTPAFVSLSHVTSQPDFGVPRLSTCTSDALLSSLCRR